MTQWRTELPMDQHPVAVKDAVGDPRIERDGRVAATETAMDLLVPILGSLRHRAGPGHHRQECHPGGHQDTHLRRGAHPIHTCRHTCHLPQECGVVQAVHHPLATLLQVALLLLEAHPHLVDLLPQAQCLLWVAPQLRAHLSLMGRLVGVEATEGDGEETRRMVVLVKEAPLTSTGGDGGAKRVEVQILRQAVLKVAGSLQVARTLEPRRAGAEMASCRACHQSYQPRRKSSKAQ
mmetsp:Transcript_46552/g.85291  ORF Transcript_46552/g.85291 Transcript_46552/m.85291 type:complete len:235 (+) Transcript_46552:2080-2784(+)